MNTLKNITKWFAVKRFSFGVTMLIVIIAQFVLDLIHNYSSTARFDDPLYLTFLIGSNIIIWTIILFSLASLFVKRR